MKRERTAKHSKKIVVLCGLMLVLLAGYSIPVARKQGYIYDEMYDNCAEWDRNFEYSLVRGELDQYKKDTWSQPTETQFALKQADPCGDGHIYITKSLYLWR